MDHKQNESIPSSDKNTIRYTIGDATLPQTENPTIICHSCNNLGAWGSGFVVPLGQRYPNVKDAYVDWARTRMWGETPFKLGEVQIIEAKDGLWVANLIGQDGVGFKRGRPVRYEALQQGFLTLSKIALEKNAEVVMPRIGCGLGGGEWSVVELIINATLIKKNINVWVVDLAAESKDAEPIFGW